MAQTALMKPAEFRTSANQMATQILSEWVGAERAGEAIGRISVALSQSAASSKKPEDFYSCSKQSIAAVVAISALTGIMPSTGGNALAYAIPRKVKGVMTLGYQLSHRGLNALANRCGKHMVAIPISYGDKLGTDDSGDVVILDRDIDNPPLTFEDLRGVMVVIKNSESGQTIYSGWVPKKILEARRAESDSYNYAEKSKQDWAIDNSTWHKWPVEMSMKASMHYAVSRGWCVIDDTEAVRALSVDQESDLRVIPARSRTTNFEDFQASLPGASTEESESGDSPATDEPEVKESASEKETDLPDDYKGWMAWIKKADSHESLINIAAEMDADDRLVEDEKKALGKIINEKVRAFS